MTELPDGDEPADRQGPGEAGGPAFDPQWWERHYQGQEAGRGRPSPHLVAELAGLPAGNALDAGCGTGADAIWLAGQGWQVTAVDVSATAVARARRLAEDEPREVAARVTWVVADLTAWQPPRQYDLVVSQYVHPDLSIGELVARLADAVGPGGTLFFAGHEQADTHSARHAPANASTDLEAVTASLPTARWVVDVAETRTRHARHGSTDATLHDLVLKAHRIASA